MTALLCACLPVCVPLLRAASTPAMAAAAAAPAAEELSQVALQAVFKTRLEDFDLLLTLRPEALPLVRHT